MLQKSCLRTTRIFATCLILSIASRSAQSTGINEYIVPTANSGLSSITAGPDGNLWFTETTANKIGRITPGGVVTEFPLPTANSKPGTIVAWADGNLWFSESNPARLARITPGGTITEFPFPASNVENFSLIAGKKGPLWAFASDGKIRAITINGRVTEQSFDPSGVTATIVDNDGNLLIASNHFQPSPCPQGCPSEHGSIILLTPEGSQIGITPAQNFVLPISINGLAVGPDEKIWHSTWNRSTSPALMGSITNAATQSPPSAISTGDVMVANFITGPDGNFWFPYNGNKTLGRLTQNGAGSFYEYGINLSYIGLIVGPDQNFWFIDSDRNVIVKLIPDSTAPNMATIVRASNYYGGSLSADSIGSIFGSGMANTTQVATSTPLPESIGGVSVKIKDSKGVERSAPLFFVSPLQINFQVPTGLAKGNATVTVIGANGQAVATGATIIDIAAPGLFSADSSGKGLASAVLARIKADGSYGYEPVVRLDANNKLVAAPIDFGADSDQLILALFGTGLRGYGDCLATGASCKITAQVGGYDAQVNYIGPQGQFVSLDQVNVVLPRSLPRNITAKVTLRINDRQLNPVVIVIK
jgi:uncharacterized protein (TIGR03437 family)